MKIEAGTILRDLDEDVTYIVLHVDGDDATFMMRWDLSVVDQEYFHDNYPIQTESISYLKRVVHHYNGEKGPHPYLYVLVQ